jgi:hypothetical protein
MLLIADFMLNRESALVKSTSRAITISGGKKAVKYRRNKEAIGRKSTRIFLVLYLKMGCCQVKAPLLLESAHEY